MGVTRRRVTRRRTLRRSNDEEVQPQRNRTAAILVGDHQPVLIRRKARGRKEKHAVLVTHRGCGVRARRAPVDGERHRRVLSCVHDNAMDLHTGTCAPVSCESAKYVCDLHTCEGERRCRTGRGRTVQRAVK